MTDHDAVRAQDRCPLCGFLDEETTLGWHLGEAHDVNELVAEIQTLRNRTADRDALAAEVERLTEELAHRTAQRNWLRTTLDQVKAEAERELIEVSVERDEARAEVAELRADVAYATALVVELETDLLAARARVADLEAELAEARGAVEEGGCEAGISNLGSGYQRCVLLHGHPGSHTTGYRHWNDTPAPAAEQPAS